MRFSAIIRMTMAILCFTALPMVGQVKSEQANSPSNTQPYDHVIGSVNDKWEKVVSDGREIYVKTNAQYFPIGHHSGYAYQSADGKTSEGWDTLTSHTSYGFDTYIVANLPESTIVGAPQSIMHEIQGNCESRTYYLLGSVYFAGKNRSGVAMQQMPADTNERKLVPNSLLEKAFDMICNAAPASAATNTHTESPPPVIAKRSYEDSKRKFIAMGLCMACADNVAQWYVQQPASRCGILADHTLQGDPDAKKELLTDPPYCTWEYK